MIVADTHALLWWVNGAPQLSVTARAAMERDVVFVAAITCWEIAFLVRRGRVMLDSHVLDWLDDVFASPRVALLPINSDVAVTAANLPDDAVRDPADRLIVATALHQQVPLVTKDQNIRAANVVQTIW